MAPNKIPNRAWLRHESGPRIDATSGSTAPDGRRTSSRTNSEVTEAHSDSFPCMSLALNPGVSVGTIKPRTLSSVWAHTIATSAIPPFVIHILLPRMTQSSPSCRAWVRMLPWSLPASASVSPKHPITSPVAIGGSQRCFCSSEPYFQIGNMASDPWTETKLLAPLSPASSSRQARPYSTALVPAHPYPSRCIPNNPRAPSSLARSLGNPPSSNQDATSGRIRSPTNRRTVSRNSLSSLDRSVSMARKSRGSGPFAMVHLKALGEAAGVGPPVQPSPGYWLAAAVAGSSRYPHAMAAMANGGFFPYYTGYPADSRSWRREHEAVFRVHRAHLASSDGRGGTGSAVQFHRPSPGNKARVPIQQRHLGRRPAIGSTRTREHRLGRGVRDTRQAGGRAERRGSRRRPHPDRGFQGRGS